VVALPHSVLKGEAGRRNPSCRRLRLTREVPGGNHLSGIRAVAGFSLSRPVSLFSHSLGAWSFWGLRTQTIETERGERREVALADGSVLNVDRRLAYASASMNTRAEDARARRALFRCREESRPAVHRAGERNPPFRPSAPPSGSTARETASWSPSPKAR